MEHKFEIPQISDTELMKRYYTIKPISMVAYLNNLTIHDIKTTIFTNIFDSSDIVDYSKLSILTDIKCFHSVGYNKRFAPTVAEILSQIPEYLLEKAIAFEIVAGPIGANNIYQEIFKARYHVSIVRLYETKTTNNIEAKLLPYPTPDAKCPIGMTETEFEKVKKYI